MPERLVLSGGRIGAEGATALGVEDGRIAFIGTEDQAESWLGTGKDGARVVDLAGGLVLPAFVDHHVHTVRTGFAMTGLDLTGLRGLETVLDAVRRHAAEHADDRLLLGQGWDETAWPESRPPTGAELERAAPGRLVCLTRVDGHSSVLSPALAALVPGLAYQPGWTPDGRVERDAHHVARNTLETLLTDADRLAGARAACRAMAAQGILGFHENAAPHIGPESEIPLIRQAAAEQGLRVTVYWGELMAVDTARRLGVDGLAGDLVADGALGSRTASLTAPYSDAPDTCGHGYVTAEQVRDHVVACTEAGLQAGFHVIGDAALEEVVTGFELAEAMLGGRLARGHRLEHVEMPSARVLEVIERLGIICSVQPMFDALWGGPDGMYAARLGERWRGTNPFPALGSNIVFGSDSPVTPLGPWAAVRAAMWHHNPDHRMSGPAAFGAHTAGELEAGSRADLAVWSAPGGLTDDVLPVLAPDVPLPSLERLLSSGRTVQQSEAA